MALSNVQICSNALVRLGAQPIESFTDGTDTATFCSTVYSPKRDFILGKIPWRFTLKFAQLSRLVAAPTAQWTYQYTLPADMLNSGFMAVYTSSSTGAIPIRNFTVLGNRLMTDESEIWVEYQYKVDESLWPSHFVELMINVMKAELCYLITDNGGLDQQFKQEVYGSPSEGGQGGLIGHAMFMDSRDNPTMQITDFSLINARFGGV